MNLQNQLNEIQARLFSINHELREDESKLKFFGQEQRVNGLEVEAIRKMKHEREQLESQLLSLFDSHQAELEKRIAKNEAEKKAKRRAKL